VAAEDGVVAVGEVIYDKGQLMAMAVEVVLLPVGLLSGGMFLFGVFQLASVIRHMLDPQRRSAVVTAGTVVSSIVAMLAVSAALFALESAVTGGDYTVFGVIIYMAVPAALGAVCIIIAMSLMDNRYSIC